MARVNKKQRMAMVRLAAVIERLHGIAGDPTTEEELACKAAVELAQTFLRSRELILHSLRASS